MPTPMRPSNGSHTLTTTSPGSTVVTYVFGDGGMETSFGILGWDTGPPAHFERGSVGVTFYDDGSFVAVNGAENHYGTWT